MNIFCLIIALTKKMLYNEKHIYDWRWMYEAGYDFDP